MKKRKGFRHYAKKVFAWLHLWIGLVAGLVVLVSMLGAAGFVWEEELTDWWYGDLVYSGAQGETTLTPSTLLDRVHSAYPGKTFNGLSVERDPSRNWSVRTFKKAEEPGWTWASGIEYYLVVYVDPYSGEVAGHIDKRTDWITALRFLHQNLLLKGDIGREIVGAAALMMIFLALSGLVLWWPKNRKVLKQRLKIKWRAKFKRVNWDLHSVGGFYTYLFLIFFAATGLVWSYKWWSNGIYRMLGDDPKTVFQRPDAPAITGEESATILDLALADAQKQQPAWERIRLNGVPPGREKGTVSAGVEYTGTTWWDASDRYYYHPATGELHFALRQGDKTTGEKWRNSNYEMHVGSIYGLPTKIIAFVCALFFAFLPVSGFLIWWGRKQKKKRKTSVPARRKAATSVNAKRAPDPQAI
ncbi:MAG: PepSY-associated TM helix domain-containing protein, partial [Bacteroidota bacterium]